MTFSLDSTWSSSTSYSYTIHLLLLHNKRVGNALSALQWWKHQQLRASHHHRAQFPRILCQNRLVVLVTELFHHLFQNQIHQLVVSLQNTHHLSSTNELGHDFLVVVLFQIQDGFLLGSVLLGCIVTSSVVSVVSVISVVPIVSVISVSPISISIMELTSPSVLFWLVLGCWLSLLRTYIVHGKESSWWTNSAH